MVHEGPGRGFSSARDQSAQDLSRFNPDPLLAGRWAVCLYAPPLSAPAELPEVITGSPVAEDADLCATCRSLRPLEVAYDLEKLSSGNNASSIAAYAAKAGLRAVVFIQRDASPAKSRKILAYGATIVRVDGDIRMTAKRLVAYEITAQLDGTHPDAVVFPCGGSAGMVAVFMGYCELLAMGLVPRIPRLKGIFLSVTDDEVAAMIRTLSSPEGLFVEPAGAVAVAGLAKLVATERIGGLDRVVCTLTGHGVNAPDAAFPSVTLPDLVEPSPAAEEPDRAARIARVRKHQGKVSGVRGQEVGRAWIPVSWPGFALDSVKRRAASSEALRGSAGYAI